MAFGGEVNHSVDVVFGEEFAYRIEIADVGTLENVVRFLLDVFQIREIAGIREFVEIDDAIVRIFVHEKSHDVRADKARTAGYEYVAFELHIVIIVSFSMFPCTFPAICSNGVSRFRTCVLLSSCRVPSN